MFSQRVAGVKRLALTQPQSADNNEDDLDPDGFDSHHSVADPDLNGTVENDLNENSDKDEKQNKRKRRRNLKACRRN